MTLVRWEIAAIVWNDGRRLNERLDEGWEPFAVTPLTSTRASDGLGGPTVIVTTIWLRKPAETRRA